jgi:hypothetical protein
MGGAWHVFSSACLLAAAGCQSPIVFLRPTAPRTITVSDASTERVVAALESAGAQPTKVDRDLGTVVTAWASVGRAPWYRMVQTGPMTVADGEMVVRFVVARDVFDPNVLRITPQALYCAEGAWGTDGVEVRGVCNPDGPGFSHEENRRVADELASALASALGEVEP